MEAGFFLLFVGVIIFAVVMFFVSGGMDRDRVREYIRSRGGQVLEVHWAPFGKGWFGEKNDRIYEVSYLDRDGHRHRAFCKTSMWTGVYWTEDNIVQYADSSRDTREVERADMVDELEEENRRLREEIARIKGGQPPTDPQQWQSFREEPPR